MPTGAKVFAILVVALLPLALIALITTLQTTREADLDARARLHAAAEESSGVLANTLANQIPELRDALAALEASPADAPSCMRVLGAYGALSAAGVRIAITGRRGEQLCGQRLSISGTTVLRAGQVEATIVDEALVLRVGGTRGGIATAYYPSTALAAIARPSGFVPDYGATLVKEDERLELRALASTGTLGRNERVNTPLGIDGLVLEMTMPGAQLTRPLVIAMVMLVLMWITAAGISWFVVDRLLIRPLRRLRREVSAYVPGEVIDPAWSGAMPAQEIRELGNTFRGISQTVKDHEAGLAEGLVRQTKLTREVHHRVKNNLQVIASLINFHARGARSAEASDAYASIQRRVDALAVVHRHHYAEIEVNRGLELRSVIGELASSIRATAPEHASGFGITLEIEPYLVSQDTAIAVAFLLTELLELAITCSDSAQVRISVKPEAEPDRALLRVTSPALVESAQLEELLETRHGRIIAGLARQLRTRLHHEPLTGAYEATIAVTGHA
ncbi:MAG: histidine kinase [Sphingomonas sp.]|nr:histidine kinase [Sphingomonas sp.]